MEGSWDGPNVHRRFAQDIDIYQFEQGFAWIVCLRRADTEEVGGPGRTRSIELKWSR